MKNKIRSKVIRKGKSVRKMPNDKPRKKRLAAKINKTLKPKRGILRCRKHQRPTDIRGEIKIIHNANFQPKPTFKIFPGQYVVRKSDRSSRPKELRVLNYQGDKLFLNDLSLVDESEVSLVEIATQFWMPA